MLEQDPASDESKRAGKGGGVRIHRPAPLERLGSQQRLRGVLNSAVICATSQHKVDTPHLSDAAVCRLSKEQQNSATRTKLEAIEHNAYHCVGERSPQTNM